MAYYFLIFFLLTLTPIKQGIWVQPMILNFIARCTPIVFPSNYVGIKCLFAPDSQWQGIEPCEVWDPQHVWACFRIYRRFGDEFLDVFWQQICNKLSSGEKFFCTYNNFFKLNIFNYVTNQ